MHCVEEIKNGIYWMGCNDFRTELFERIFPIPEGVTYNSYFIDDEKTCVVDAMDKSCRDEFLEDVEYLLKGRKLDYFVLQHMEQICQLGFGSPGKISGRQDHRPAADLQAL